MPGYWVKCIMRRCAVIITCAPMQIRRWNRCHLFLIIICGPDLHRYVRMMDYHIAVGATIWNMVMALWAICAYICLMRYAGCLALAGLKIYFQRAVFMLIRKAKAILPIHKPQFFLTMILNVYGS